MIDFPCLHTSAAYIALSRAQWVDAQAVVDYLKAAGDRDEWEAEGTPGALAPWPLTWVEWGLDSGEEEPAQAGVLFSTRRHGEGFEAEAVAFFCNAPMLCYRLTYGPAGDLEHASIPRLASAGGGLFLAYGWEAQARQLRESPEMLRAFSWLFLAPALLAIAALNFVAIGKERAFTMPGQLSALDEALRTQGGLGQGNTLPQALRACRHLFATNPDELPTDLCNGSLWAGPESVEVQATSKETPCPQA